MKVFTQSATLATGVAETFKLRKSTSDPDAPTIFQPPEHLTMWLVDSAGKRRAYPCVPVKSPQGNVVMLVAQALPVALRSITRYEVTDARGNMIAWCSLDEAWNFAAGERPACTLEI